MENVATGTLLLLAFQPVLLQPLHLGFQGLGTPVEGAEDRPLDGRQIGQPASVLVGLDVAGPVILGGPRASRSISSP